jgi:hypothetical protein
MATNPAVSAHPVFGVFIAGFFARFGWLDIPMNNAWYKLITIVLGLLLAGALAWAWRERARFSKWWAPLAFCVIAVVGNLLVINIRSYQEYVASGLPFAQGRYLLPLLGILGAGVVAGAQGFKRWGPAVAAACVCGLMLLNLFGMTLVLSRFYV